MNELHLTSNPYLQQHQTNPVFWKLWSEKTIQQAQQENKLIIVSIGYSTCHWCHVMERESFTDNEVAQVMNDNFISIKVDREEHPDVDAHYMKAVQLMTKQGGWPLNVVCLPNGKPIWGGTYFPKKTWIDSLLQLNELYKNKPEAAVEFAKKLDQGVYIMGLAPEKNEEKRFNKDILIENWKKSFDYEFGGYQRAPKFMMPTNLLYLQKLGVLDNDKSLLQYIDITLTRMAWGGIFDVVEGGFSRYSVDFKWHVPHFEKMLYDNAQLLSVYSDAYKRTANSLYKEIIEKTIKFITTNWITPEGASYSALDADSMDKNGQQKEGAFYVWTKEDLENILGDDFFAFSEVFNINDFGYWEENNYVLIQNQPINELAAKLNLTAETLVQKKQNWENKLFIERKKRATPFLDNKIITAWNAQLITGLLDAYSATKNTNYLAQAKNIQQYIQRYLFNEENGLLHSSHNNKATILGYLDDYAFYIQALINLYEHTAQTQYLEEAKQLLDNTLDLFLDIKSSFFYYNQEKQAKHITRSFETEDNVIPSSNAVLCMSLLKLSILFENEYYSAIAHQMLATITSQIDYPSAYSHWLLCLLYTESPAELSVVGKNSLEATLEIRENIICKTFIFPVNSTNSIPYLKKYEVKESNEYYLCENKHCFTPTKEFSSFLKL